MTDVDRRRFHRIPLGKSRKIPEKGIHGENSGAEVEFILNEAGFEVVETRFLEYAYLVKWTKSKIPGRAALLVYKLICSVSPGLRDYIMVVGRKTNEIRNTE